MIKSGGPFGTHANFKPTLESNMAFWQDCSTLMHEFHSNDHRISDSVRFGGATFIQLHSLSVYLVTQLIVAAFEVLGRDLRHMSTPSGVRYGTDRYFFSIATFLKIRLYKMHNYLLTLIHIIVQ